MATVYILYSASLDSFYIGSCLDLDQRLLEHNSNFYLTSFTSRASDWKIFWSIENQPMSTARAIEAHIKKMKSRKYLKNLKTYPDIASKLIAKYSDAGSSR